MQAETRLSGMLDYSLFCIHFPSMRYGLIFREISAFRRREAEAFVLLPEVQRPQFKCSILVPFFYIIFLGLLAEVGTSAPFLILSAERVVRRYSFVSH